MTTEELDDITKWADIVLERWEKRMRRLKIHNTYELMHSLESQIMLDSRGSMEKAVFTFLYYGKFVDMGVGNGVTLDKVGTTNRKPKFWYFKSLRLEIRKLGEVLAERRGIDAINYIKAIERRTVVEKTK